GGELTAVADDDRVAGQLFAIGVNVWLKVLTADFLFAFDQELNLNRQLADGFHPGLNAFHVRQHLTFVVRRAAGIDISIAHGRFERRADPFVERLGRLNIVVTVAQDDGFAWNRWRFRVYEWMAFGRNYFCLQRH